MIEVTKIETPRRLSLTALPHQLRSTCFDSCQFEVVINSKKRNACNYNQRAAMKYLIVYVLLTLPSLAGASGDYQQELETVNSAHPDWVHGAALFSDTCIACHGPDGSGRQDGDVPAIAGQHYRVIVRQLVGYRHDHRWDLRMEHFTDRHRLVDAQDVADVAAFVSDICPPLRPGKWAMGSSRRAAA